MAVEWSEITSTEWEEKLGRLVWAEERVDGKLLGYQLLADCPRCEEPGIDLHHTTQIIRGDEAPVRPEIYVECECTGEHPGRPDHLTGCGARTSMVFVIPTGTGTR